VKKNLSVLFSLVVLASILLAACGGGAATEAPAVLKSLLRLPKLRLQPKPLL